MLNKRDTFTITGRLYAVFDCKGTHTNNNIFQSILTTWLLISKYQLQNGPHFKILREKHAHNGANSEKET